MKMQFDILANDKASSAFDGLSDSVSGSSAKLAEMGKTAQTSAGEITGANDRVRKSSEDVAKGYDRAAESADTVDTRAMGFRDTMTGVQDSMSGAAMIAKGDLFNGFFTLGMGIGDLASGFANFLIPAFGTAAKLMVTETRETVRATAASVAHKGAAIASAIATKTLAAGQWLLNAAMSANPIGIVVVALAALAAGVIWAYKNVGWFRAIVDTAFKAIAAVAQWLWNSVFAPVLRFLINGFATLVDWVAGLLDALGNIPGFGWAKDAAAKLRGASDAARKLAGNIRDIPDANVTVHVGLSGQGAKLLQQSQGRRNADVYYGRAAGGPVRRGVPYAVGDNADGSWNPTTEIFWPDSAGTILSARQSQRLMAGGGTPLGIGGGGPMVIENKIYLDGRLVKTSLQRLDRQNGNS